MSEAQQSSTSNYGIAIRRPVTTAMIFLTLLVFGLRSYQQLPINLMPDIDYPTLTVRTEYEGASPEVVENLVTRPLEEMLSIVSGLVEVSSVSSVGLSEIIMEFTWDTDMNMAQQDVRDRLDLFIAPQEITEKPVILRFDPTLDPIMQIAITAPDGKRRPGGESAEEQYQKLLTAIREATERHLKSDLEAKAGIAQVLVKGGQEAEVQVLVDPQHLKSLGLTMEMVGNSLAQQNISQSSGRLKDGRAEFLVRTFNEYGSVEEIHDAIITSVSGRPVRLADVAKIYMGTKERETIVRINGREAVGIEIFKEGDANTVDVCNQVKDLLGFERELNFLEDVTQRVRENIRKKQRKDGAKVRPELEVYNLLDELPDGVELTLISDQSRFIQGSIAEVKDATIIGGILALMILFVFLRELKSTMIIGFAIPISVVATFVPLFMRDISLNIMSLGGLALGVGMLVDNSIVVLESIFRCKEEGDDPVEAASRGTREVASAVIASTLTTICVFMPITFVEGIAGQLFGDLALTVTFSLLASLLTALYLIPLVASRTGLETHKGAQVFWVLRAWHDLRNNGERSLSAAVLGVVPRGMAYMADYARNTTRESFAPIMAIRKKWPTWGISRKVPAGLFLPFLLVLLTALLLCQLALGLLGSLAVSLLFTGCLVLVGSYLLVRTIMRAILWLPLRFFDLAFNAFRAAYGATLEHALRFSPVILLATVVLAGHAVYTMKNLGSELIPPMKQGEFTVRLETHAGTRLEQTELRARDVEAVLRRHPDVDRVTVEVGEESSRSGGDRGENVAEFTVLLVDPDRKAVFQDDIIEDLRAQIAVGPSEEITFQLPSLFSFKTAIELQIVGEDLDRLRSLGEAALERVAKVPGVTDAELSVKPGYPEIIIHPDRALLAERGISVSEVAAKIRYELQGDVPTRFSVDGEKIDIRIRSEQRFLDSRRELEQLNLGTADAATPLDTVTDIQVAEGPSEIRRVDQRRVVVISANIDNRDLAAVSHDILASVRTLDRPQGYYFELGGQNRELETSYSSLYFALLLAIFLVYVVMASQFESFWHPALVMASVPLAFIGVVYSLDWMAIDLSIMVFLGGIILAGIVVNDAIVLVDYINQLRSRGRSKRDAIVEAGTVRLRPIIMTTVTTVLGLLPMIVASGEGSEMRRPMAVTVMAGLTSATVLTLIIIPVVYYLFTGKDRADNNSEADTP